METHYSVLGVVETASNGQIKQAYLRMVKNYHPDKLPAGTPDMVKRDTAEKFLRIREAYDVLSGSDRFLYDSWLETQRGEERHREASNWAQQNPPSPPVTPRAPSPPKRSLIRKIGLAWSRADSYVRRNSVVILLWLTFFVVGLPSAIFIPQPGGADGNGWNPKVCDVAGTLLLFVVLLGIPVFHKSVKSIARIHPKISLLSLQGMILLIIALAVGANNPSPNPAPKLVQEQDYSLPPPIVTHNLDPTNPVSEISERFATRQDKEVQGNDPWVDTPATGGYHGSVHNLTADQRANFGIFVEQYQYTIQGCMTVQNPLSGSGPLRGSVTGPLFKFNVTTSAFHIEFEGVRNGNQLSGRYQVIPPSGQTQQGEFTLDKTDDERLPLNFNPKTNCPTDTDVNQ